MLEVNEENRNDERIYDILIHTHTHNMRTFMHFKLGKGKRKWNVENPFQMNLEKFYNCSNEKERKLQCIDFYLAFYAFECICMLSSFLQHSEIQCHYRMRSHCCYIHSLKKGWLTHTRSFLFTIQNNGLLLKWWQKRRCHLNEKNRMKCVSCDYARAALVSFH